MQLEDVESAEIIDGCLAVRERKVPTRPCMSDLDEGVHIQRLVLTVELDLEGRVFGLCL